MARRPTAAHNLALRAAEAAAEAAEPDAAEPATEPAPSAEPTTKVVKVGRPRGRRAVSARFTLYLDERRHAALVRMAEHRGRSIHSLILEGTDHIIGNEIAW